MSWDKIDNHLFDKYCVEGEDKELSNLMEEHDKEIRNQAIDEFVEEMLNVSEGNIDMYVWCSDIKEIAEQMKAGAV